MRQTPEPGRGEPRAQSETAPVPDLAALLAGLGDSPDAVAAALERAGCRGLRGCTEDCPVADYLYRRGYGGIDVSENVVLAWDADLNDAAVATPPAVAEFIDRFDLGEYPALVAARVPS